MIPDELSERIRRAGVIAVVTIESVEAAPMVAQALYEGGVSAIELTFRTAVAPDALRVMRESVPEMLVGAGTILTAAQVAIAQQAGAAFGVSPGCNPATLRAARDHGLPFAPGVMSPTDIEIALMHDCRVLKFFPAETSGGLGHLRVMAAPFAHLGLKFIPLGGVSAKNLGEYLDAPEIVGVGGSWLAPIELIRAGDWDGIRNRAAHAMKIVRSVRQ